MLISPTSPSCNAQLPLQPFLSIIPQTLAVKQKISPKHFTRNSKLPLPKVITCTLSLVANGNHHGVDSHTGTFFRSACRSGLWPGAKAIHRTALVKARQKVPWEVVQATLRQNSQHDNASN